MHRPCLALALLLALAPPLGAQTIPTVTAERQIYKAFEQGKYERALDLVEKALETSPGNVDLLYNGACAHARLGHEEEAVAWISRAIEAGFREYDFMLRDPDLASVREILEAAVKRAGGGLGKGKGPKRKPALDIWREKYGEGTYRYERDEKHNLAYATALDRVSHAEMREMLEAQADQMIRDLFGAPQGDEVLIAVPTPADARGLFGTDDRIGGIYQHRDRRLVARDIGSSLRHEFFHAVHYGHMERLRQMHPLWIQEGMAALYEDYELDGDAIRFLPNGRHNIAKRRARNGRAMKWRDLFTISNDRFMRKAGQLYPQVRSIFEYVAARGKLDAWYAAYVDSYDEDATGATAFERVFEKPVGEVERDWRRWVSSRPDVDDDIAWGDAALGIESRPRASNDGVLVERVLPGSAAAAARVRRGDVIVAADGRAVRSLSELRTLIGPREVGEQVKLRVRRDGSYLVLTATLQPLAAR